MKAQGYENLVGHKRFQALMTCYVFSNEEMDELVNLLMFNSRAVWSDVVDAAYDEMLIPNQKPSNEKRSQMQEAGDPIPHHYIPRKPHPNGLLAWVLATKSSLTRLPFCLWIVPDYGCPTVSARDGLRKVMAQWDGRKLHFVTDAAVGGFTLIDEIAKWGGWLTSSISQNSSPWLWRLLARDTPYLRWNACFLESGVIASLYFGVDATNRRCRHHLITNAFTSNQDHVSFSSLAQADNTQPSPYSNSYLRSQKVPELRAICATHKIAPGRRNKHQLIEHMEQVLQPSNQSIFASTLQTITSTSYSDNPVHHNHYHATFNSVDLSDRNWHRFKWSFRTNHWRTKMFLACEKCALHNTCTLFNEHIRMGLVEYRNQIIDFLLSAD